MKKGSARKAKESDFGADWKSEKGRRAAKIDLTWNANDLSDSDMWRDRKSNSAKRHRP